MIWSKVSFVLLPFNLCPHLLGLPSNMEDLILLHLLAFRHQIYTSGALQIFNFTKYSCHLKSGLLLPYKQVPGPLYI